MKKPIIKNWIKYWTTTIAVSGMLALGACENNGNQTADNTADNIETTTEETATTTRENVNQGMDEAENETEQLTNVEESPEANQEADQPQPEYERTADTRASSERSATAIRDMDSHIEEHKEVNEAIKEELTDLSAEEQNNAMGQQGNTMGQAGNQDPTQQQNTLDEQRQDTLNRQQENTGTQQRTFNQQNDTQMNQQGDTQRDQQGNQGINQQGEAPQNQQGDTQMNQQDNQGINQQGDTQMDQQSNTEMGQNTAEDPAIIYERHIMIYGEDQDEENRQRMEDIGREYSERRESMRGQMDEERGTYVSPEVDPQPKQGYDHLMNQIQENIEYPQDAAAAEMEGTVYVNFILDENGNITEAQAYEDIIVPPSNLESTADPLNPMNFNEQEIEELREEMRKEAVRAVEKTSGMWEPGMQDGQAVKTEVQLPVQFNIAETTGGTGVR